ncbi:hypothetical protein NLI96_g10414 [Meripilus lineatus]|uniref:F-box domain-containing protein n=1 Tax=Meripilus lineatus TaxID=2056292 RepID=A0AAD5UTV0_9APHY|nr:hypothetical protein NLI96_g10414 [Physisporinus lineatus]
MKVPEDVISLIVDEVRDDVHTLCQCSLTSRHFLWLCQHYLFSKIAYRAEKTKKTTFEHLIGIFEGSNNIGVHITHLVLSGLLDREPKPDRHSLFKKVYTFIPLKASELQKILAHTPNLCVLLISCVTLLPEDWDLKADFRPLEPLVLPLFSPRLSRRSQGLPFSPKLHVGWHPPTQAISLPQQIQDIRIEFRIPKETLRVVTEDLENLFHQPRLDWDPIDETLIQFSALKSISIGLVPIRGLSEEVEENRARLSAEFEDNVKLKLHRAQARGIL